MLSPKSAFSAAIIAVLAGLPKAAMAQPSTKGGADYSASRTLVVPTGKSFSVIVTEFYHSEEIKPDGRNLGVYTGRNNSQIVPFRLLQLGPGDYCRLAIQAVPSATAYEICYGGEWTNSAAAKWTNRDGLFLETRQYSNCDLNHVDAVRKAFQDAKPIGADYVEHVFHSYNPCTLERAPFMSRYSGVLHLKSAGKIGFFTTSRDCSFLLIDGKVAASAPGRHGPIAQAKPGTRSDVTLAAGPHDFEYYHVATTTDSMAVAAWELDPRDPKPAKVEQIPSENFRTQVIGRLSPEAPAIKTSKLNPDFTVSMIGSAPLPDNDLPMVKTHFRDLTPKSLILKARGVWDFGDGQTSDQPDPEHVYLRPGLFKVTYSLGKPPKGQEVAYNIYVGPPIETRRDRDSEKKGTFDEYLPLVSRYDPCKLDAVSLRQLIALFEAKAAEIEAGPQDQTAEPPRPKAKDKPGAKKTEPEPEPEPVKETREQILARRTEAARYITMAAIEGRAALVEPSLIQGDDDILKLAQAVGPLARDRLGNATAAFAIWEGAVKKIKAAEPKAICQVEAASVALNDLLQPDKAKPLLEAAAKVLGTGGSGPTAAAYLRTWGDYCAVTGDGKAARKAYFDAEKAAPAAKNLIEQSAWRGAHNRSTEDFLKLGEFDRAAEQLRQWEREFPTEKIEGTWTLMYARYWAGREKYDQAVALVDPLINVNPDSAYVDQLLFLAANCEVKRGKPDRALATLKTLLKDYPGSPLVPKAKEAIGWIESGGAEASKKPAKKPAK